jgi:hypothetical protein
MKHRGSSQMSDENKLTKELILHWIDNAQYGESSEILIYHLETKLYLDLTLVIEQAIEWYEDSKLTHN